MNTIQQVGKGIFKNNSNNNEIYGMSFEESTCIKAIRGCKESFLFMVNMNKEYLYKTAYLYVKNEEDAKEIYQKTIYKAYLKISSLKNPKYFKTWITKILINNVNDKFKKQQKEIYIDDCKISEIDYEAISIEEKLDLYEAIDLLKSNHKTAIILRYFNDLKFQDIAFIMGCSENTVKSYVLRAKKHLLSTLRGE